ncbi:MAG: AAA family ATPase [Chloroflexi bacterium]|nr:AAA family ATPase [Chloroflexota bacterium]
MMRLRSIDLHGYKSFATRTALQFDEPVTAIVGPNGSGKSNVMDALRWVIGAGAGRVLRTKRAEDVVFSGGRDRAPSGFAEVRLRLDNSDQWLNLDAAEVEIVRRVHRDGQSEVRVNGRAARLRDVQGLFRSSGLGAGGFALMSQGLVDEMLRLRPHERRQAIEEVGGVRQHRHEMEESRRRRQRAQDHLDRARLLRDELAPRLKSLERSARRAKRQADLQQQLEQAQQRYFRAAAAELEHELLARHESATAAAAARSAAEQRRESATNALAAVERETAIARRAVESAAEKIRAARSELRTLEHQQELDQQQRSWLSREVSDLSARLPRERLDPATSDLDAAKEALAAVSTRLNAARSERDSRERSRSAATTQHERALADIESFRSQAQRLNRRWRANAAAILEATAKVVVAQQQHETAQDRLREAESRSRQLEREDDAARQALERQRAVQKTLTRRLEEIDRQISSLEATDEHEQTLRFLVSDRVADPIQADALFGELMDATLHEHFDDAVASVQHIVDADVGRASAMVSDRASRLIDSILASVEFVEDVDTAKRLADTGKTAVTSSGIVVRPDGVVQAGGSMPGARRRLQQLAELKSERSDLRERLSVVTRTQELSRNLDELVSVRHRADTNRVAARQAASESAMAVDDTRRRHAAKLVERRSDLADIGRVRSSLQNSRQAEQAAARQLATMPKAQFEDLSTLEAERDRCAAVLADARAHAAALERARADRARLSSLRRELADVETAILEREPLLERAASIAADAAAHDLAKEHLDTLESQRAQASWELEQAQQARVVAERREVEASSALRETESSRARLAAEAASEGIEFSPAQSVAEPVLDLVEVNGVHGNGRHAANGLGNGTHRPTRTAVAVAEAGVAELKQSVQALQAKLHRLGPVDPGAAHEFASEQTRWQDMESQIVDLEQTESSLRIAERDLEQLIERKFREACRQVDEAFQRYFQLMFRGGKAELVLTEDRANTDDDSEEFEQPSRLGVDIRAQPPGKRVSTLGLLSGGERALTAIALLFALLEVRPAPFCILDEVDAALDEANVERFVAALKERAQHTQFVVITHNRRTIEQADSIYGVTMGAAGVSRLLSVRVDQLPQADS